MFINRIPRSTISGETIETRFITEWTVTASDSITLPLVSGKSYNFTVDYGDGTVLKTVTSYNDTNATHDYSAAGAGTYTVIIDGLCTAINTTSAISRTKLTKVVCIGDVGWTTADQMFRFCTNLTEIVCGGEYLSNCSTAQYMLDGCTSLTSISSVLDLRSASSATHYLQNCGNLLSVTGDIILTSCSDASYFFLNCKKLVTIPDIINVTGITNFAGFFQSCEKLNSFPTIFDMSSATIATKMLGNCYDLTYVSEVLDISSITGTNAKEMFNSCKSLMHVPAILDVSGLSSMFLFFANCFVLEELPSILDVSNATDFNQMLVNCYKIEALPSVFNVSSATTLNLIIYECNALSSGTLQGATQDINMQNCNYDATGLDAMYTALGDGTGKTITVTGNPGVGSDNPSIATAKNWTVVGSN